MSTSTPRLRVLLVDDHPVVRTGVRRALEMGGMEVVGDAATPSGARASFEELRPDVAVVDIRLDGGNGLQLTRELTADLGLDSVHVVIFSAIRVPSAVSGALSAGALGYVVKGSAPDELVAAINAAAVGEQYLCPIAREIAEEPYPAGPESLTPRELQIVSLLVDGWDGKQIASKLGISWRTVTTHRENIRAKFGGKGTAAIVQWAYVSGLVG